MRPKFPSAFELFYAVFEGTIDDVRARLAAGDDLHARSAQGATPLFHALRLGQDLSKADLLFEAGARVDVWDNLGMQPVHWTAGSSYGTDVSRLAWLLGRGAEPSTAVRQSADLQVHPIGWTPLHIATDRAFIFGTQLLLERHANVNASSADGSTALHVAAGKSHVYKALIRKLLDAGANLDAIDAQGRTALHILAEKFGRYRKSAIQLLRHRGARIGVRDFKGRRPIDLVVGEHPDVASVRELLTLDSLPAAE